MGDRTSVQRRRGDCWVRRQAFRSSAGVAALSWCCGGSRRFACHGFSSCGPPYQNRQPGHSPPAGQSRCSGRWARSPPRISPRGRLFIDLVTRAALSMPDAGRVSGERATGSIAFGSTSHGCAPNRMTAEGRAATNQLGPSSTVATLWESIRQFIRMLCERPSPGSSGCAQAQRRP